MSKPKSHSGAAPEAPPGPSAAAVSPEFQERMHREAIKASGGTAAKIPRQVPTATEIETTAGGGVRIRIRGAQ